jgi:hypothetical protein
MNKDDLLGVIEDLLRTPNGRFFCAGLILWVGGGYLYKEDEITELIFFAMFGMGGLMMTVSAFFAWFAGKAKGRKEIMELDLRAREELKSDKTVFNWRDEDL